MIHMVAWLVLGLGLLVVSGFMGLLAPVLRLRIHPGKVWLVSRLPGDYHHLRTQVEPSLRALGFHYTHTQARHPPLGDGLVPQYLWVYQHAATQTHALLASSVLLDRQGPPYQLEFLSIGEGGSLLSTVNAMAHQLPPLDIPELHLVDAQSPTLAGQWQAHQEALQRWSDTPVLLNPEAFIAAEQRFLGRFTTALAQQGWLRTDRHGHTRLRVGHALRFLWRALRGEQRVAGVLAQSEHRELSVPLAAEMDGFRRHRALHQGSGSSLVKILLFLLSVLLFSYSFGLHFSWDFVAMLVVVLLFHELGHLAGMWWFGYRDLRILFIPFLGAVAMGRDQQAQPRQRILVSLLGPLPGLLLGLALLHLLNEANSSWLLPWIMLLLVLNYLNLLPILPLDGGQVVNITLLGRFPRLQLLFATLSTLLAALAAWFLADPVLWVLTGLLILASLSMRARLALRRSLRERLPHSYERPEEELLTAIFQRLREDHSQPLSFTRKLALAQGLLRELQERPASPRVAALGLTGYAACLLLPPLYLLLIFPGLSSHWTSTHELDSEATQQQLEAELAHWQATLPPHDPRLAETMETLAWYSDPAQGLAYLQGALSIRQQHPDNPLALGNIHAQLAGWYQYQGEPRAAADHYQALAALVRRHPQEPPLLGWLTPAVDFFLDQDHLAQARELLMLQHQQMPGEQRRVLATLGWLALQEGDLVAAQRWLEQALDIPQPPGISADVHQWEQIPVLLDLMVISAAQGHAPQAQTFLQQATATLDASGWMSLPQFLQDIPSTQGWQAARRQRWRETRQSLLN